MKKVVGILMLLFVCAGLFSQNAAQMSYSVLNSDGIREIDKNLQEFKKDKDCLDIDDAKLIENFQVFTLAFLYNNQVHVLAYDKADEIPEIKDGVSRGVYLFRSDSSGWHAVSDRVFTGRYVEHILVKEHLLNPSNTNVCVEPIAGGRFLFLVRNRVWVSDLETNLGSVKTYMSFVIFTPQADGTFKFRIWEPTDMFDFFPEDISYVTLKNDNSVMVATTPMESYVKFIFGGEKLWESSPDILKIR